MSESTPQEERDTVEYQVDDNGNGSGQILSAVCLFLLQVSTPS